jgi:hypothetical protein
VLDRFAPEYRAALQESFQRCAREGTPYDLGWRRSRRSRSGCGCA